MFSMPSKFPQLLTAALLPLAAIVASAQHSAIDGYVHDREGQTVPGITVAAYRLFAEYGAEHPLIECRTLTDRKGWFACPQLPEGDYLIAAAPASLKQPVDGTCKGYSQTFYPSTADPDQSLSVQVAPYSTAQIQLTVHKAAPKPIRFTFPRHETRDSVELVLHGRYADYAFANTAEDLGNPGSISLCGFGRSQYALIETWSIGPLMIRGRQMFTPGDDAPVVTVPETSFAEVDGLLDRSHTSSPGSAGLRFIALDTLDHAIYTATPDKAGRFRLALERGRYSVQFASSANAISSVSSGDDSQDGPLLDLSQRFGVVPVTITATSAAAELSVVPCDTGEQSEKTGFVLLNPQTHEIRTAQEDHGMAVFRGLQEGTYLLSGWQDLPRTPYYDEGVLLAQSTQSRTVRVSADEAVQKICTPLNSQAQH